MRRRSRTCSSRRAATAGTSRHGPARDVRLAARLHSIEGKILGQYIKKNFPGQKVGVLYQDDDFGNGGLAGIEDEVPASDIVSKQPYESGTTTLAAQVTAIKAAGATVQVDFTVPIYTAIAALTSYTLGYHPQLVSSSVGIDPTTVGELLSSISKGKASGSALIDGTITDGYLPSSSATSNPWVALMEKIVKKYDSGAPWDGNTEYGVANAYTLVQALEAAGKNLTRQGLVHVVDTEGAGWGGPGLVPFRYSTSEHGGYGGAEIGKVVNGKIILSGGPLITSPSAGSAITPYTKSQASPPASGIPSN